MSDGIFKVIATSGDPNLGGDDLMIFICKWLVDEYFVLDFDDLNKQEKFKLVKQCKLFKEELSNSQAFLQKLEVNECVKRLINIDDFNKSVEKLVDRTITISQNCLMRLMLK